MVRNILRAAVAGALSLSVAAPLVAQQPTPLTRKLGVAPDLKMGKLPNGLTYYIKKNIEPLKRAELRLVVNAGSVLEDDDQLGYAHFVDRSLAQGYVPKELATDGAGGLEIEILGERRPAKIQAEPLFDPEGARMRG